MSSHEHKPGEEQMILAHDAVKGYRPVYYACITLGVIYLGVILAMTL
jgi:hypothetical protein